MSKLILEEESFAILGACFEVHNELGCGFLESVYHQCLEIELASRGVPFRSKSKLRIQYKGQEIEKTYEADFICFDKIILEIKAISELADEHTAQTLNYLNATKLPLGLLINFGHHPKLQHKRLALTKQKP